MSDAITAPSAASPPALPPGSAAAPQKSFAPAQPKSVLSPAEAWQPLPASEWNADAARHLLRRAGWTAKSADVERAMKDGLATTLDRLFPAQAAPFPAPASITALDEKLADVQDEMTGMAAGEERQMLQRQLNGDFQQAEQDLTVRWLQFASGAENSVTEKWVLFLSDVYVVSQEKVKNPQLVYAHHATLRAGAFGSAPALTKAVSRSPAMIMFLDLQQSQRSAPNENFARELFELFLLGEGNYTEPDIKEAARAFTGYRQARGTFRFAPAQHDPTAKTVFGRTGNFSGDDVIDLACTLPAAGRFLPHELARFYLTDDPLPKEHLAAIGDWWRTAANYDLRRLAQRFFGSRLFFDAAYRGNYIKSPVQFFLGLGQDLNLDIAPIPRRTINPLRLMDQIPFRPPNVRGWVGGRSWINSSTLAARRQAVELLFAPLTEASLNADEVAALRAARAEGEKNFNVTDERLLPLSQLPPQQIADQLLTSFLPLKVDDAYRAEVVAFLTNGLLTQLTPRAGRLGSAGGPAAQRRDTTASSTPRLQRLRSAIVTLLQSPEYQLC
jgi:uncharacterized protein (DUF1800 family)